MMKMMMMGDDNPNQLEQWTINVTVFLMWYDIA